MGGCLEAVNHCGVHLMGDMNLFYPVVKTREELEQENRELTDKIRGYFNVLGMILGSMPNQEIVITKELILAFDPSKYMISQTEDLMNGTLILKLRENNYGKETEKRS
jgi:hypothetical protein